MQLELLPCEFQVSFLTFLDERTGNDRHKDGVNTVSHVLNQCGITVLNSNLQLTVYILGTQSETLQFVLLFFLAYP